MAKTNQNFQIYRGEVKNIVVTITDSEDEAVDLSTKTILYRVSKAAKSSTVLLEKETEDMEITGEGQVTIPLEHDDTDEMPVGSWYHELRIIDGDTVELVVMTGTFKVDYSITNVVTE